MLNLNDILIAAVLTVVIVSIIKYILKTFSVTVTRSAVYSYPPAESEKVLQRCCSLFPTEMIRFNGVLFKRGMVVRVSTDAKKIIEGKFIGINNEKMVCVLTSEYIVAHELDSIKTMDPVG